MTANKHSWVVSRKAITPLSTAKRAHVNGLTSIGSIGGKFVEKSGTTCGRVILALDAMLIADAAIPVVRTIRLHAGCTRTTALKSTT